MGQIFQRVVHVGGRFGIFTNNYMIELATDLVLENSAYNKGRGTSMQVLTKNLLRLGNSEPVRQLKKAGVIFISVEQHLQVHISAAKILKSCMPQTSRNKQNAIRGIKGAEVTRREKAMRLNTKLQ